MFMAMIFNNTEKKSELQKRISRDMNSSSSKKASRKSVALKEPISLKDSGEPDYSGDIKHSNFNFWISAIIACVIVSVVVVMMIRLGK